MYFHKQLLRQFFPKLLREYHKIVKSLWSNCFEIVLISMTPPFCLLLYKQRWSTIDLSIHNPGAKKLWTTSIFSALDWLFLSGWKELESRYNDFTHTTQSFTDLSLLFSLCGFNYTYLVNPKRPGGYMASRFYWHQISYSMEIALEWFWVIK